MDSAKNTIFSGNEPIGIFKRWFEEARNSEVNDPDAVALATVDENGLPNVRMVLLRVIEKDSFVFFTNYKSAKGKEILQSGKVAFVCHWKSLRRQIRVRGQISKDESNLSVEYYNQRPLESRIGAWASKQSKELKNRSELVERIEHFKNQFGEKPEKPYFWGGFRIKPIEIEFWRDGQFRIHDRFLWKWSETDEKWSVARLNP